MDATPTLHDFVLNLLVDPTARAAFELDPEATLQDAGLGDITTADVQEVIPLVVDYAPVDGITGLVGLGDVTSAATELDVAGAVGHLQAITAALPVGAVLPTADVNATAASAVTVNSDGLLGESLLPATGLLPGLGLGTATTLPAGVDAGVGAGVGAGLSAEHDPAASVDASVVAPVGSVVTGVTTTADGLVADTAVGGVFGTLDLAVNTVGGVTSATGLLDSDGLLPATSSVVGSVVGPDTIVGGTVGGVADVDATLTGVGATVDGAVAGVGGLVGGLGQRSETGAEQQDAVGGVTDLLF